MQHRGADDDGRAYRDYVLGTGNPCTVWRLIDRAFALAGLELEWRLDSAELSRSRAYYKRNGYLAVVADERLVRPFDPLVVSVDPARAREELGWMADANPDTFLSDMLEAELPH
jgi:GDP-D-mannose dehydratase